MHFHEQLFAKKGWKTEGKITSIRLISVLRSDYIHKPVFKKYFLENVVLCMDRLDFKIPKTQIVLDEAGCRAVILKRDPALCEIVEEMISTNNTPLVFFGEDSPLSAMFIDTFAKGFCRNQNITEYIICLYSPVTLNILLHVHTSDSHVTYTLDRKQSTLKVKQP